MEDKNIKKNYLWNTIGTTLFAFNSLFFMIVVTRLNGTNYAGIFSFAFSSAAIINIIALYSGRTYQVTDNNTEVSESTYVLTRVITSSVAVIFSVMFVLLNQYSLSKASIFVLLCVVKCFDALSDVFYGMLHKRDRLYIVGKSMAYKSLLSLIIFICIDFFTNNIYISCLSLVIVNIGFLFLYDKKRAEYWSKIKYSFNKEEIILLLKKSSYTFFFTLILLIIINVPKYTIDMFLTNEDQAIYGIISMPATFIVLLGQFILQPALTQMSNHFRRKDKSGFNKVIRKIVGVIVVVLLVVAPIAYFIGIPVLQIIYGINLSEYKWFLMLIIFGAAFYTISNVLLNALIVLNCTKEQMWLQSLVLVFSVLVSILLTRSFGLNGSIFSYFVILFLQFIAYFGLYCIMIKGRFVTE